MSDGTRLIPVEGEEDPQIQAHNVLMNLLYAYNSDERALALLEGRGCKVYTGDWFAVPAQLMDTGPELILLGGFGHGLLALCETTEGEVIALVYHRGSFCDDTNMNFRIIAVFPAASLNSVRKFVQDILGPAQ